MILKPVSPSSTLGWSRIFLGFFIYFWAGVIIANNWLKKVNSVTTTVYYGPKRQNDAFFHYFWWRNLYSLAHTFSKLVHSLKKHIALTPIFYQKKSPFSQNTVLSCHFFSKFSWITPSYHADDWQKSKILSKLYFILNQKNQ